MARHCRGLICLTLTPERCDALELAPMVQRNGTRHGTAFTVSIEAAEGIDTGISAADRAHTVRVAISSTSTPDSLVHPGHVFPLRAASGGVLMRAGHTEARCDLAQLAGKKPAAVICEIMNDDGTMARVPQLVDFAKQHGIKLGTIADLIRYRNRHERLIEREIRRPLITQQGEFELHAYRDAFGGAHLVLTLGQWSDTDVVPVRVHEPLSVLDLLETNTEAHSWPLPLALQAIQSEGRGAVLLLNAGAETSDDVLRRATNSLTAPVRSTTPQESDLRLYGIGAQILQDLAITRMKVLGNPRRFPSMGGYDLVVESFLPVQAFR